MNLVGIREQFVKESGRYDLVSSVSTWANNGADFYIQRGSRYLDRFVTTSFSKAKHYETAEVDEWYKIFQEVRSIQEVWVSNDEYRKRLELRDVTTFREYYNEPPSSIDSGTPTYYTPALLRTHPQSNTMYLEKFVDTSFTETSKYDYEYNGIMWMPPTDEEIIVEVHGLWYCKALSADADNNYWSVNHPEALVAAACLMLAMFQRNSEAIKDWTNTITLLTSPIEMDMIEEESYNVIAIKG